MPSIISIFRKYMHLFSVYLPKSAPHVLETALEKTRTPDKTRWLDITGEGEGHRCAEYAHLAHGGSAQR